MLDPKVRHLPSISGMSSSVGYLRHAYCQGNFRITGKMSEPGEVDSKISILLNFCKVVEYAVWHMPRVKQSEFRLQINVTKISGVKVTSLLC